MDDWLDGVLVEKHQRNQINHGQINTGELLSHHACDPIRMDILTTGDKEYGIFLHESGENSLQNLLDLPLLQKYEPPPLSVGTLSMMTFKKYGLGLQNMVMSVHKISKSSKRVSVKLVNAVTGTSNFSTTYHFRAVIEERSEG